ncbi:MAG: hypothetical protein K2G03_03400 [Bacilli bacterium]|nr:hypothetical protein [Bacilli bacterium]
MLENYKIERLKTEIQEACTKYHKNHNRIPDYIIVNNATFQEMVNHLKGMLDNDFGTFFYQGYRIAIDNGMKDYEFKVVGD